MLEIDMPRRASTILAIFLSGGLGLFPRLADFDPFRVSRVRSARSANLDNECGTDVAHEAGDSGHCEQVESYSALNLQPAVSRVAAPVQAPLAAEIVSPVAITPEFTVVPLARFESPAQRCVVHTASSPRGPPADFLL